MDDPRVTLTTEQLDALGQELDALRKRVMDDLGEADVTYIRNLIKAQRALEFSAGDCCSRASCRPPGWPAWPPSRCRRSSTTWRSATT